MCESIGSADSFDGSREYLNNSSRYETIKLYKTSIRSLLRSVYNIPMPKAKNDPNPGFDLKETADKHLGEIGT